MIAQIPNSKVLVVDAKASGHAFDLNWTALRPLVEYTNAQKLRQRGQLDVGGAVLVAAAFKQPPVHILITSAGLTQRLRHRILTQLRQGHSICFDRSVWSESDRM